MATQSNLLKTKTTRLNRLGSNIRFTELGDDTNPPYVVVARSPGEFTGAWYAAAPLLAKKPRAHELQ